VAGLSLSSPSLRLDEGPDARRIHLRWLALPEERLKCFFHG